MSVFLIIQYFYFSQKGIVEKVVPVYLVSPYLAGPNCSPAPNWPALIWPRPKLAFGWHLAN